METDLYVTSSGVGTITAFGLAQIRLHNQTSIPIVIRYPQLSGKRS